MMMIMFRTSFGKTCKVREVKEKISQTASIPKAQ
jgi:hypothetical protein